jgi:fibro-slime domain-containing protein
MIDSQSNLTMGRKSLGNRLTIWLFALALVVVSSAEAVLINRTIMFYKPLDVFGSGLTQMKVREANVNLTADAASPDYWSVTISKDSSQYNNEFNQGNYSVFFQITNDRGNNQCFDAMGWRKGDQNCTNKYPGMSTWTNDTMWIVPDLITTTFKPDVFFSVPVFWNFYFYVPEDPDWLQGNAQIIINGGAPVNMSPDPVKCGWYKMVYYGNKPDRYPPTNALFTVDVDQLGWQLGLNGMDDEIALPIDLAAKFLALGGGSANLFFSPEDGALGWTTSDPGDERQCTYDIAAILYDSDASLHKAFTCYATGADNSSSCTPAGLADGGLVKCIGVTRGIVEPTIDVVTRKPIYNPTKGCFESADKFNQLFKETNGVNKRVCTDLTFSRAKDGMWEYDSYNEPLKAFYPLENEPNSGPGTKREGYGGVGLNDSVLAMDASGFPRIDLYVPKEGEFNSGTNPNVYDNTTWDTRIHAPHNQHFCFESHAPFVYRPGMNFFFRGDDDIWVFINDKLVIDLGGTHLAAPGHVGLDTLGLTEGEKYQIDIFFCDRRTDMSNIRIKTNMYFEQKKDLYFDKTVVGANAVYDIKKTVSGGLSCAALETGGAVQTIEGSDLSLEYTLLSSKGDTMDPYTGQSLWYGGITIAGGTVTIDSTKLSGLAPGRYRLTISEVGVPGAKATIYIKIAGNLAFWSVNRKESDKTPSTDAELVQVPAVDTLAGRLVPFQIAKKSGDFIDESDATFQISFPPELKVYRDSLGQVPVLPLENISTGVDGVETLWATGSRKVLTDTTYQVTLKGSKSKPLNLRFHLPNLTFVVDTTTLTPITDLNRPALGLWSGTDYPQYILAFDPADGSRCFECNDTLTAVTVDSLAFSGPGGGPMVLVNGIAMINIRGTGKVVAGSFVVTGPSPIMKADWKDINLKQPPTPQILAAEMYDQNSDGKADSLFIGFKGAITSGDSIPDFVVVTWPISDPDTLIIRGRGAPQPVDSALVRLYPTSPTNLVKTYTSADGMSLSIPFPYDQVNTKGVGQVAVWFTFTSDGVEYHVPRVQPIADKIPPVIRRAQIKIANAKQTNQFDTLVVVLSETVDTTALGAETPFEFQLLSATSGLTPRIVAPKFAYWKSTRDTVTMFYDREALEHPRAGDSVRISLSGVFVMKDTLGNVRSAVNPWVVIDGNKRNEIATIGKAVFDPNDPMMQDIIKAGKVTYIEKVGIYDDIEKVKTKLAAKHGAVLGHVIKTDLSELVTKFKADPKNVVLHYETSYHTNLGGFVAGAKDTISCANTAVFGPRGCASESNGYVFVGWNMLSAQKRLVGSGAYVARIRTWVTIPVYGRIDEATNNVDEIWGVMRAKGVIH